MNQITEEIVRSRMDERIARAAAHRLAAAVSRDSSGKRRSRKAQTLVRKRRPAYR